MIASLKRFNTLRNQIVFIFLIVMILVLSIVSVCTFNIVSNLLKANAEKQIQKTTVQISERVDALYRQIDIISKQVITDAYVQQLLLDEVEGRTVNFDKRQALMKVMNGYHAYGDGIHSFELYQKDQSRLFPLNGTTLSHRIDPSWIERARAAGGKLVWIGTDPKDPKLYIGIRQVSLMDRWFSNGGYLLTRVDANYFRIKEAPSGEHSEYMAILDRQMLPVFSNYDGALEEILVEHQKTMKIDDIDFIVSRETSTVTGWTTVILTPVSTVMQGLSVLKAAILFSGIIGFFIFSFFSFFLSTMITRPILNLIKTMRTARVGGLKPIAEGASTVEFAELNRTYNQMVENTNHLIGVVYEKELLLSQAELKALQAQINPHFLYNTLEALYWSLEEKEEELAEVVVAMSNLFRYTISNPKLEEEWVFLKEELQNVEAYLQIMKMRFGDRLSWQVSAPPECRVRIPKLLIQPLVENAILHGVGNKNGAGMVSVIVEDDKVASRLLIKVMDDGPGIDENTLNSIMQSLKLGKVSSVKGKGMAIANVHKRLQLYFKEYEDSGLCIESSISQGTAIAFIIPY